jgi:hypothetical protein
MTFHCTSCGKVHEGLADLSFAESDDYDTVPERERERPPTGPVSPTSESAPDERGLVCLVAAAFSASRF